MRNLKRALSLALASVMLLGMMVVGTSASYADVTSKQNKEAIEVAQAVGVMVGDDKGNFNPDAKVTRVEMAVVMSNLLNLKVDDFKAAKTEFTDVPAWAAPYVAACKADGIIAGYSATYFGANDTVTAAQAALMVMKALGYFQFAADFGDSWQLATVKQASKISLYDGIDANANTALTRNDVAQLVLNALEATMVETDGNGGTTIKGDGFEISTGSTKYVDRTSKNEKYGKIDDEHDTENKTPYTVQLGEDLYDGDLKKSTFDANNTVDDFGRPATLWEYKNEEVGTYADTADYTFTKNIKNKALYDEVGKTVAGYTGWDGSSAKLVDANGNVIDKDKTFGKTAKGVLTEVFVNDDAKTVKVVYIYSLLAQVDQVKVNKDNKDKVDVTLNVYDNGSTDSTIMFTKEDSFAFAEDEWVIVYTKDTKEVGQGENKKEIADATKIVLDATAAAKVVKDQSVSRISGSDITVSGTKYSQSKGAAMLASYELGSDYSYDLYFDTYGYVIGSETAKEGAGDLVYVTKVSTETQGDSAIEDSYVNVKYVALDGTTKTVKAACDNIAEAPQAGWNTVKDDDDNDGWFKFTSVKNDSDYKEQIKINGGETVESSNPTLAAGLVANSKTIFILDDGDDIKVVTGIKNMKKTTLDAKGFGYGVTEDDSSYAVAVYLYTEKATGSTKAEDVVYVMKADGKAVDENGKTYYIFKAIVNGEASEIHAADANVFSAKNEENKLVFVPGLYELKTVNNNGYVNKATVSTAAMPEDWFTVENLTKGEIDNGVIAFTGDTSISKSLADKVTVLVVDGNDINAGTTSDVKGGFKSGTIYFYAKDGEDISIIIAVDLKEKA